MSQNEQDEGRDDKIFGANTAVRLGAVGAVVLVFASAIWWAAQITSKIDSVQASLSTLVQNNGDNKSKIDDLIVRVKILETAGTPKSITLEKDLFEIRRLIELHMAKENKP